jgi:hypothetical protein
MPPTLSTESEKIGRLRMEGGLNDHRGWNKMGQVHFYHVSRQYTDLYCVIVIVWPLATVTFDPVAPPP